MYFLMSKILLNFFATEEKGLKLGIPKSETGFLSCKSTF